MAKVRSTEKMVLLTQAKRLYVEDHVEYTYEEIAKKLDLPLGTIKDAAVRDGWQQARQKFQASVEQRYIERRAPEVATSLIEQADKVDQLIDQVIGLVSSNLESGELKFKTGEEAIRSLALLLKARQELATVVPPSGSSGGQVVKDEVVVTRRQTFQKLIGGPANAKPAGQVIDHDTIDS